MDKKYRVSNLTRNLIVIFVISTVFIIIAGITYFKTEKEHIRRNTFSNLSSISSLKVNEIKQWRSERIIDAILFSMNKGFIDRLKDFYASADKTKNLELIKSGIDILKLSGQYSNVFVLDKDSKILLTLNDKEQNICDETLELYKKSIPNKAPVFSEFYNCSSSGKIHLDIFATFFYDNEYQGGLILETDPDAYLYPFIQKWPVESSSAETYLIKNDGGKILFLNNIRHQKNSALKLSIPDLPENQELVGIKAIKGIKGLTEGIDYRRVNVLANISNIEGSDWILITKIDSGEVFDSLKEEGRNVILFLILVIGFIGTSFVWFYHNRKKSITIEHMKSDLERKVIHTHYSEAFKNANDMIFLLEENGNVIEANNRAVDIFGYSQEEFRNLNIFDIRAKEFNTSPAKNFSELISKGKTRFETINIKKSGEQFPAEVSASIIETDGKKYIQAVVQDISIRKKIETESGEFTNKLNKILSNIYAGILLVGEDDRIEYVNNIYCEQFDLEGRQKELIGMPAKDFLPIVLARYVNPEKIAELIAFSIKEKIPLYGEEIELKNGRIYTVDFIPVSVSGEKISRMWVHRDITEKKHSEQIIADNEEKYSKAFRSAPYAIILSELDTGIINEVNEGFVRKTGYSYDEILGKTVAGLNLWYDISERNFIVKELSEKKAITNREITVRNKSGERIIGLYSADVINLNNKKYILASINDITELKKAEIKIRENEANYRMLAENINDVIWTIDAAGKFIYVSPSVFKLRGYTVDEVMRQEMSEVVCPDSLKVINDSFAVFLNDLENDKPDVNITIKEIEQPCKDGTTVWTEVAVTPVFDKDNNFRFFLGVSRDITERRKAERKLIDSEKELQVIFDNAPATMLLLNSRGEILKINRTGKNLSDKVESELLFSQCGDLLKCVNSILTSEGCGFSDNCKDCNLRISLIDTLKTGREYTKVEHSYFTFEVNARHKRKTVLFSTSIATLEPQKTILLTIDDITERKILENELRIAKERAEELYRVKTNFLANMSHELRTPMVGILGFSEMLSSEIQDEEQKHFAEMIHKGGSRLMETLNLILDLSLVESDKIDIKVSSFDLISEVNEVIGLFQKSASNKRLYLIHDSVPEEFIINIDKRITRQILNNLINNAVKYTLKGGVVVRVNSEIQNGINYAVIRVEDTGIGIPEDKWDLIWEEFRQVSEGYGRTFEGTGLGLSITKKFIQKLKGEICVEKSVADEGTTMKVMLPADISRINKIKTRKRDNIQEEEERDPSILPSGNDDLPVFLYVEDEAPAVLLVKNYLRNICEINVAVSSKDALEKAGIKKYDAILMDINLGKGLDGIQTVELIRAMNGYEKTPIVAVTAYAMKNEKEEFIKRGCTHYLSKPFLKKDLVTLVKGIIKKDLVK
ncbi:MAG: PAS domain S-box protein [Ignavibacteria bacterium]|nr:PAS domain S-box protein [Ignavibacteria bacterium]